MVKNRMKTEEGGANILFNDLLPDLANRKIDKFSTCSSLFTQKNTWISIGRYDIKSLTSDIGKNIGAWT